MLQSVLKCLAIATLFITLTTGCWDRSEIDDLAIVLATGLDLSDEGNIVVTSQFLTPVSSTAPTAQGGDSDSFTIISVETQSIHDSMRQIQRKLSRTMYISHRKVLVIGEALAKQGLDILDHFSRNPKSRIKTYIVIAKQQKAADLLSSKVPFEKVSGEAIRAIIQTETGVRTKLGELITDMNTEGIVPTLPSVELVQMSDQSTQQNANSNGGPSKAYMLSGAAVIKNYKLTGYLSQDQTRVMLWLKNKLHEGIVTANIKDSGKVSMRVYHTDRSININQINERIKVNIDLRVRGPIHENNTHLDLSNPQHIQSITTEFERYLSEEIDAALNVTQTELKADILGIGEIFYRQHSKQWRGIKDQWDQIYPDIDFNVTVHVEISDVGQYGAPVHIGEEQLE